ncbi:hypothetical protein [Butyrivibrio sp. INlla16]|uniref:hypothetical protein n=1 Tax=Butyrivibrio sp. INlla16 TaxID=1520807 RepID=UPI00088364C7|nr:hypothetical protein [Butyrivibrio sp. INlla16]SDB37515.1 Uncharacterized membrane protein [Butyrivibrio sp. INlla16]
MKIIAKKYNLLLLVILVLQIVTICFFGVQKEGFHQDEYYSYFSTNRSLGFYYPDREWVDTDTLRDEFVVKKGEGFNYGLVHLVQSWDVHPPLFYDMLHTVCSLTPEVFSKWQGLIVNIIAFIISFFLLNSLAKSVGMSKGLRLILMFAYGFNPMTISCVMFIRMYMWLTVFVLASALCHMRLMNLIKKYYTGNEMEGYTLAKPFDKDFKIGFVKSILAIAVISFLGFLTQYYFLIFMVMMGLAFGIWFLFLMPKNSEFIRQAASMAKRLIYILVYGIGCAFALGCAVLVYPASLSHIFRGYRGQEAQAAFADGSNIIERFGFFIGLANDYLMSGMVWLIIVMIVIALIGLFFFLRIKREKDKLHIANIRSLFAASAGYFFVVAKTALLLGDTSNRYEMPIYPIILLLAVYFTRIGLRVIVGARKIKEIAIPVLGTFLIFAIITAKGLFIDRNVLFLYPEDRDRIKFSEDMKVQDAKAVVIYNSATPDNIWRLTDELLVYDKLYYVDTDNTEAITDSEIAGADILAVYAADHDNRDEILNVLMKNNPTFSWCGKISQKDMWTVYEMQ